MKTFSKNFFSLLSVLLVAALVSFNCGGNGDGGKDVATDQGQDVQEPKDVVETAQETAADTGPELVTYTAVLTSFFLGTPVEGAKVTVVDNDTGTDTTTTTTSGANGAVEFQLEKGKKYGFKATLENYMDTYQFNIDPDQKDDILWIVANQVVTFAATSSGLTIDAEKGIVAGAVYWVNANKEEEPVGCATVESDPAGDIRYTGSNGLPASPEVAKSTNKEKSYFIVANVPPGKTSVKSKMDTTELGSVSIFTFKGSIAISNVYATGDKNPTPENCQ